MDTIIPKRYANYLFTNTSKKGKIDNVIISFKNDIIFKNRLHVLHSAVKFNEIAAVIFTGQVSKSNTCRRYFPVLPMDSRVQKMSLRGS